MNIKANRNQLFYGHELVIGDKCLLLNNYFEIKCFDTFVVVEKNPETGSVIAVRYYPHLSNFVLNNKAICYAGMDKFQVAPDSLVYVLENIYDGQREPGIAGRDLTGR